jgi:dolichyl-phosphate beta-glucosyltransferase
VAIASREAPGAVRIGEPAYRHLGGRLVNTVIQLLALPGLQDTQCGFKCFRAEAAENLFKRQTMTGWSFDIEILYLARKAGYRILEIPIPYYYHTDTKLNAVSDAFKMVSDILKIRRNERNGVYR